MWPTGPGEAELPPGADTEVRLPLRAGLDADDLVAVAAAQAPDLLLALPTLAAVDLPDGIVRRTEEGDTVRVGERRWHVVRAEGEVPSALLAGLAVEDRARTVWRATWALPGDGVLAGPERPDVLHAPTPTDERTTLPARLLATVPLDPDRRHVRDGPVTEHVLAARRRALPRSRAGPPSRGAPRPRAPRRRCPRRRSTRPCATRCSARCGPRRGCRPRPAPRTSRPPARRCSTSTPRARPRSSPRSRSGSRLSCRGSSTPASRAPRHAAALAAVGVARVGPAALVDALTGLDRPVPWWRGVLAGLAALPGLAAPGTRAELAGLPVPLADGRVVAGARERPADRGRRARSPRASPRPRSPGCAWPRPASTTTRRPASCSWPSARGPSTAPRCSADPPLREAVERSVDDAEEGPDADGRARLDALAALVLDLVADGHGRPGPRRAGPA